MNVGKLNLKVHDPIFHQRVLVLLNNTEDDYRKLEKRLGIENAMELNPNFSGFTTHIYSEKEPNTYVIFIPHFDWTIDDQSTLIHEIVHVVFRIWQANNIPVVPDNQEFLAHSIDGLFMQISRKIFNNSKKKKDAKK